ncbi:MAG: ABC transporter ATP-binding protein [Lachnospiraceae bacterium]|nr:ABC transporter ATP-binding protein [Lachnospiraceae bacterium]
MNTPILELKDVNKLFPGKNGRSFHAVHDISLQVFPGESIGIVGESGCGKSTLARMITGLTGVSSGSILLQGKDIARLGKAGMREIYRNIQMVFQEPYSVFSPRMHVGTFLEEGLVYFGIMSRAQASQESRRLMKMVDLPEELLDRLPHQLSGGQLQRVVIARAISIRPRILLLDEATSALDVSVQKQILELLTRLQRELGLTYLFIGHDLAVVRSVTDRIEVMYSGRIVEELSSECLEDQAVHPYTKRLLASVFSVNDRNRKEIRLENLGLDQTAAFQGQGCAYAPRCEKAQQCCRNTYPDFRQSQDGHRYACWHAN